MDKINPALLLIAALLFVAGLHVGLRVYTPAEVWGALAGGSAEAPAADFTALIVRTARLPRALLATVAGAALGLAGLIMQSATRNPVAEPGLLGVNAGAAFAVAALLTFEPGAAFPAILGAAAAGSLLAAVLVFGLALVAGVASSPSHLLLAGVSVAALLMAAVQVLMILNESSLAELLFWLSGSFADRPLTGLAAVAALTAVGAVLALGQAGSLDVLQSDDATAAGVGLSVTRRRLGILGLAAVLTGGAVALAGPVSFIGLLAPHLARLLGARGHRALIPRTMLCGLVLALSADLLARFVIHPSEAPVSAVMALVGGPCLIALLRGGRLRAA